MKGTFFFLLSQKANQNLQIYSRHFKREKSFFLSFGLRNFHQKFSFGIDSWRGQRPLGHFSVSSKEVLENHCQQTLPNLESLRAQGFNQSALRAHSYLMWNKAVTNWALSHLSWTDLEIEAKGKNLASKQLYDFYHQENHTQIGNNQISDVYISKIMNNKAKIYFVWTLAISSFSLILSSIISSLVNIDSRFLLIASMRTLIYQDEISKSFLLTFSGKVSITADSDMISFFILGSAIISLCASLEEIIDHALSKEVLFDLCEFFHLIFNFSHIKKEFFLPSKQDYFLNSKIFLNYTPST